MNPNPWRLFYSSQLLYSLGPCFINEKHIWFQNLSLPSVFYLIILWRMRIMIRGFLWEILLLPLHITVLFFLDIITPSVIPSLSSEKRTPEVYAVKSHWDGERTLCIFFSLHWISEIRCKRRTIKNLSPRFPRFLSLSHLHSSHIFPDSFVPWLRHRINIFIHI